ncbi:FMN-binding negative transcriptional regulator [Mucilaginibacter sp. PAMB04274]|uniref:FMN-binding negative transcriptional regulator n=1 Tax=Mucilaginibacter sp. PAMB04274 TaxID=3138568 RepID=UPI0031F70FC6
MYIPKHFQITDTQEAVSFMQRYSFATLVNNTNDGLPQATHLPFLVKHEGDAVVLSSHLAAANPQASDVIKGQSLVIFTEPHAYIAPKHYEKDLNVPTWNYIAVHAYGVATIVTNESEQLKALEHMVSFYDAAYLKQWNNIPLDYKLKMCKGIVVFDIKVTDLQGKKKLSQNRNDTDQQSIITAFSHSNDVNERVIADYMQLEATEKPVKY